METTRVPGSPAHNAAAIARQKPGQEPAGDDNTATRRFLGLLTALGGVEGVAIADVERSLVQTETPPFRGGEPFSTEVAQGLKQGALQRQFEGPPSQIGELPSAEKMQVVVQAGMLVQADTSPSRGGEPFSTEVAQGLKQGALQRQFEGPPSQIGELPSAEKMQVVVQAGMLVQADTSPSRVSEQYSAEMMHGLLQAGLLVQKGMIAESLGVPVSVPFGLKGNSCVLPSIAGLSGANGIGLPGVFGQVQVDGLVAQTARIDAAWPEGAAPPGAAGGMPAARSPAAKGRVGGAGGGLGADLAAQDRALTGKAGAAKQAFAGSAEPVAALSAGSTATSAAVQAQGALWTGGSGAREVGFLPAELLDPSAGGDLAVVVTHSTRSQEQGPGPGQQQGGAALGSEATSAEGVQQPAAEASYEAAMAVAEEALSEQVTYWVHQNLQKAQLSVEHEGGRVDVSVALQGNEAHVSLMADQAQARDALDADQSQLRELLRQQGLELAGLTVGLSAGRQSGQQERSSGQSGQPSGTVAREGEAGTTARVGVRVLTDRAVDLFV